MKIKNNITYHTIKKVTNLSIGTISRYFNNGSISKSAKAKIEKFIQESNYEPNIGAKLIKGYDNSVYLVICSIKEEAILEIVSSIINSFKAIGIYVYIVVASYNHKEYLEILKKTIQRKPKTLILLAPIMNEELRNYINNIKIKTYIYGDISTNKSSIVINEEMALYLLTSKIIEEKKYQKIIYIGKSEQDLTTGKWRLKGFLKAIHDLKMKKNTYFYYLMQENSNVFLKKNLDLNKLKKFNNKTIIICGTHTIFKYLYFERIKSKLLFDITDIGYISDYDYINSSYKYKLFIDFYNVGLHLYNQNFLEDKEKVIFDNFWIAKKDD